jgi:hypothetical protein
MVQSIVKSVVNLVSAVEENQQIDFHDFDSDFQSGANWITHALEVRKEGLNSFLLIRKKSTHT